MKILIKALLISSCVCSCTHISGDSVTGKYSYTTLGGDAHGIAQTSAGYTAESLVTSPSFLEGSKTIRTGLYMAAAKAIAGSLSSAYTSVSKSNAAADVTKHAATEGTKQVISNNQTAVEQASIAAKQLTQ